MLPMFRRTFLAGSAVLTAATAFRARAAPAQVDLAAPLRYPFAVPALPYAYDANEPSVDADTMRLHHDKHHAAYVANLNAALKDVPDLHGVALPDLLARVPTLPEAIRTVVRNNGGGHANHTMFWQIMGGQGGTPGGDLGAAVSRDFGSFDDMKARFNKAAAGVFGSGWAMITTSKDGHLAIVARPNQDSPLIDGQMALFGNDVWEHAYYLRYQNRRADYLAAWWNVLDWNRIGARYAAARAGMLAV